MAWVLVASKGGGAPDIALKVLKPKYAKDPQFTARFLNEATIAGELRHPNIIRILETGQDGEAVYFAMPMFAASLASRLEETAVLPEPEVARTARDVARALAFAHDAGVIHRDIKPQNILCGADGHAVLTDFGIARAIASYVSTTGKQLTIGTPHYISPEQLRGESPTERWDLWALAVVAYEMLTGAYPFATTSGDWRQSLLSARVIPTRIHVPDAADSWDRFFANTLAPDPAQRPASAAHFLTAFEREILADTPTR